MVRLTLSSGDISYAVLGVSTVNSLKSGAWTVFTSNPGLVAAYQGAGTASSGDSAVITQTSPASDLGTADVVVKAMDAFAGATVHTTGGNLDLVAGAGATTNGSPGNVVAYLAAPTGSGSVPIFGVNYGGASAVSFNPSTGAWNFGSSATAPGLAQAVAGSGVTPVNTTLSAQAPNASSSTTPSGTPAEVVANWAVPVSTGHESAFLAERNGAAVGAIGVPDGYGAVAVGYLWLGANAALGTRTSGNFAIAMDSSGDTFVNSTSGIAGFTGNGASIFKVNSVTGEIGAPGNYSVGALAGTYDGCVGGCVGFAQASSNPSGTATGSVIYADHATGDLVSYPLGATAPVLDVGATVITTKAALNPGVSNVAIANCSGGTTTLSAAQSATTMLIVGCTTGTTASTVQSAIAPTLGTLWIVRNVNATASITFEWSSGSGVTLTHGTSAVITSDGTNAFAIMNGT